MSAEVATVEVDAGEPQFVFTVTAGARVLGYVVINSFVRGRSCVGLRKLCDVDEGRFAEVVNLTQTVAASSSLDPLSGADLAGADRLWGQPPARRHGPERLRLHRL